MTNIVLKGIKMTDGQKFAFIPAPFHPQKVSVFRNSFSDPIILNIAIGEESFKVDCKDFLEILQNIITDWENS